VSLIQVIICSSVPISGPSTSDYGPMKPFFASSIVYFLVILSTSPFEYLLGSNLIPPLAPPNGMLATVSLKVMRDARATVSYRVISAEYLVPPLTGIK